MRKGQEEAPIELLIAVTLLTFVIILGFYTYQNICTSQYEQKLKASLSGFARNLELIYEGAKGTSNVVNVDFGEIGCSSDIQSIKLLQGTVSICQKNLAKDYCLELLAITKGSTGPATYMVEILNIPPSVTIVLEKDREMCTHDLNSITPDKWSSTAEDYTNCGWLARAYSFRVTKEESDKILIEQIGG